MKQNWKDPRKELPPLDKSYRCLAKVCVYKGDGTWWNGYADVFFSSKTGWKKCETEETVEVEAWMDIGILENYAIPNELRAKNDPK